MNRILRIVLFRQIPEDPDLRGQWNAVVMRVEQPQVFYTYEWALAVQRAYGEVLRPLLFLAYEEGDLCGVAALATDTAQSHVSFLCATTGDYCDFLSAPERRPVFVAAVLAELKTLGHGKITLANLPGDSNTVASLKEAGAQTGYFLFSRTAYDCAQIALDKLERRPEDNQLLLLKRKMLRRVLNTLERVGPLRLDHARSWDEVQPILPAFVRAHVARFLFTGRISNLARHERRIFLEKLAKLLSETGWLALTQLMAGNRVCAWNYGFQFDGSWFWYQPTFDSSLEKSSPGFCLVAKIIEEAANTPAFRTVDLGLGAEEYKDRLANQNRETLCVTLRRSRLHHVREKVRYHTAQIIKASPRLETFVRRGVKVGQRFRRNVERRGVIGTLAQIARRVGALLWSRTEVFFFEACGVLPAVSDETRLEPLNLDNLASAVSQYADDNSTCDYLLRSTARLRERNAEGFDLLDADGTFLHFAWVTAFNGFVLSELNAKVEAPSADCVMLFDCWTPAAARGRGHYAQAIGLIAKIMQEQGKRPWIFSAAGNVNSLRGLKKAGFQYRYSVVRHRFLGWQRIERVTAKVHEAPAAEVSVRI